MTKTNIAEPIRDFFERHLTAQRGLSGHTILAYRDSLKLLLQFAAKQSRKSCTELTLLDLSAETVRRFLNHLEQARKNSIPTRNARLAAIHAFFQYLGMIDPRHLGHCQAVLSIPFKRQAHRTPEYLDHQKIQSIFAPIDVRDPLGRRDDALLRMLYNTGMRAQELVDLNITHLRLSRPYSVLIHGKGRKERTCPLWNETMAAVKSYVTQRGVNLNEDVPLFVNNQALRLTRFGVRSIIAHRVAAASQRQPSLHTKTVTPHTFRHTTAMHLL